MLNYLTTDAIWEIYKRIEIAKRFIIDWDEEDSIKYAIKSAKNLAVADIMNRVIENPT